MPRSSRPSSRPQGPKSRSSRFAPKRSGRGGPVASHGNRSANFTVTAFENRGGARRRCSDSKVRSCARARLSRLARGRSGQCAEPAGPDWWVGRHGQLAVRGSLARFFRIHGAIRPCARIEPGRQSVQLRPERRSLVPAASSFSASPPPRFWFGFPGKAQSVKPSQGKAQ